MRRLTGAERILTAGLANRAYSAVSAEIGTSKEVLWTFAAGTTTSGSTTPVTDATIFDLASLTKVIATATLALTLVRRQVLALHAPVASLISQWDRPDRRGVSVADLLEHCSGLPAHREYYRTLTGLTAYVAAIAEAPLEYAPRTRAVYSDLGFITLGAVLERAGGASLGDMFEQWKSTTTVNGALQYLPPASWRAATAATQYDPWRARLLQGEVDDGNAAALGGVAAHAGLFGTAAAVGEVARWWMRQLASDEMALRFAERSSVPGSSRALGWDAMLPTSSCGSLMSDSAIGHTGFTGTTLWIDRARNQYFVLLTNRVHLTTSSEVIQQVRREFHDAAIRELT